MTYNRQNHKKRPVAPLLVFFLLFSGAVLSSCAAMGPSGKLQRSRGITQAFENNKILIGYRYYHSGWANNPYVIIGIDKSYSLSDRLWTEFTPSSQELNKLVAALYNNYDYAPYGAYILDHAGKRVGIWYSAILWAYVRVNDDTHTIEILPDTPYLRDDAHQLGRF